MSDFELTAPARKKKGNPAYVGVHIRRYNLTRRLDKMLVERNRLVRAIENEDNTPANDAIYMAALRKLEDEMSEIADELKYL